jgi:glutamate-1-semialdehyde 2,1-aminomutase
MITNFSNSNYYRERIHQLIPGGAHTYSKGDDQFPLLAPAAIAYGKGAYVWDIDGNKYLDCSMGLTSVSLGHAYQPVLDRVMVELEKGVNFQRPSSIELEMAEKFLSLVPSHQMIKFAKNGSVVTSAAVKLARAFTQRRLIAFPSDHPFYSYDDWFIGKTQCSFGVPDEISLLSVNYKSGDIESLKALFEKYPNQIAAVISEPERNDNYGYAKTQDETMEYLIQSIELVHKYGALYINDEMITGFKSAFPGTIAKFGLNADLTTWGKGIANGFSFCALTGKQEVMALGGILEEGREKFFLISTTHGGETHAIGAGIKTIEEFQKHNVVVYNQSIGDSMIAKLKTAISSHQLGNHIEIMECNWNIGLVFRNVEKQISNEARTLVMQEMIKRGILFQGSFVPCYSHTQNDVQFFVNAFEESLKVYKDGLDKGFNRYLVGPSVKPVFRKYI